MTFDWSKYKKVENESSQKSDFDWSKYKKVDEPSRAKSLTGAAMKGLVKGGKNVQSMMDPFGTAISSAFGQPSNFEEKFVDQHLPQQEGRTLEPIIENAFELAPMFAVGPEGALTKAAQVGAGALGKEGLKKLGAPEIVQDIGAGALSLAPQALGGALAKKISPSVAQKEIYDLLKGHGFSEKSIVPFIQSKKKVNAFAKWGKAFLDKDKIAEEGKPISEAIFGSIKEKGKSVAPLTGAKKVSFEKSLNSQLDEIPYFFRKMVAEDVKVLKSSNMGWENLRDFEKAISAKIKGVEGGKEVLGILKEPINFGERLLDSSLFREKQIANKAYAQHKNLLKNVSASKLDNIIKKGEIGAIVVGFITGNPFLKGIVLKKGGELAAAKYLSSPRFQGMQRKLVEAVNKDHESAILEISSKIAQDLNHFTEDHS